MTRRTNNPERDSRQALLGVELELRKTHPPEIDLAITRVQILRSKLRLTLPNFFTSDAHLESFLSSPISILGGMTPREYAVRSADLASAWIEEIRIWRHDPKALSDLLT